MDFKKWYYSIPNGLTSQVRNDLSTLLDKSWTVIRYYMTGHTACPKPFQDIINRYALDNELLEKGDVIMFPLTKTAKRTKAKC